MPRRPKPAYAGSSPLLRFADRVRRLRESRGWSQEELAERADRHFTFVSQLERGERAPGLLTILRVADALGVDPGDLVTHRAFTIEDAAPRSAKVGPRGPRHRD